METTQPTSPAPAPATAVSPGLFGGKIPSVVAYAVGILLFFLPFLDIKCNNYSLQQVSGFQLATGFKLKNNSSDNSFLNDIKTDKVDEAITKTTTKTDKKDPNLYALIGLGLGVLGLLLSFTNAKAAIGGSIITGVASAAALIGLMVDVKKKVKLDFPDTGGDDAISKGIDKIGSSISDNVSISVDFTPWFYVAVIAFLAAAFFSYKRFTATK